MREFKFRYWHRGLPPSEGSPLFVSPQMTYESKTGEALTMLGSGRPIEVMQFTGKKDKNGTSIYEGDIVTRNKRRFDWDKPDGQEEYEVTEISTIVFRNNGFWVNDEQFGWEGELLWDWNEMEVIGNIYEHPLILPKKAEDIPSLSLVFLDSKTPDIETEFPQS